MRNTIFLLCALLLIATACQEKAASAAKPNIVFLFADDQTFNTIRHLGNPEIHTPNLDRLAQGGTSFTNAFNMGGWHGAVCVASRSMMISGKMLWQARQQDQIWREKDYSSLPNSWGQLMRRAGYNTYMSGKWHVALPADSVFTTVRHIRPGMPRDHWGPFARGEGGEKLRRYGKEPVNLKEIMPVGYHRPNDENDDSWLPTDTSHGGFWQGGTHWSEVLKDDALDYIADATAQEDPFFMYLAFNAPHDPRQSPQAFLDLHPLENITVPENWLPEYPWKDSIGNGPGLRDEALAPFPRTEYAIKKHLQEYYAIISHLDHQVGLVLDALEEAGVMDNTYIFFSADHGLGVGQHGLLGKQNMFDHSMRVPLLLRGPGIPANRQLAQDVYLQDIMATSLEIAGISKPAHVQFHSFLPLARGESADPSYDAIYGAYVNFQRMIRKDGYKLIAYPKAQKLLLFDLAADPKEMRDLAASPDHQDRVRTLFAELQALQAEMDDDLDLSALAP